MIVCHCRGISDRRIREAIREGACSPRQVARACHAGGNCGGCRPAISKLIESEIQPAPILATPRLVAAG